MLGKTKHSSACDEGDGPSSSSNDDWLPPLTNDKAPASASSGRASVGLTLLQGQLKQALSSRSRLGPMTTAETRGTALIAKRALDEIRRPTIKPTKADARLPEEDKKAIRLQLATEMALNSVNARLERRLAGMRAKKKAEAEEGKVYAGPGSSAIRAAAHGWRRAALQKANPTLSLTKSQRRHQTEAAGDDARKEWRRYRREQEGWKAPPPPKAERKHQSAESKKKRKLRQKARRVSLKRKPLEDRPTDESTATPTTAPQTPVLLKATPKTAPTTAPPTPVLLKATSKARPTLTATSKAPPKARPTRTPAATLQRAPSPPTPPWRRRRSTE